MGLDIGVMRIESVYLPKGVVYKFGWEMAIDGAGQSYMHGAGNSLIPFTQRQVLLMLEDFSSKKNLTDAQKTEIREWVRSLPWDGWVDNLDITEPQDDDHDPVVDGPEESDGGLIELYFNW